MINNSGQKNNHFFTSQEANKHVQFDPDNLFE